MARIRWALDGYTSDNESLMINWKKWMKRWWIPPAHHQIMRSPQMMTSLHMMVDTLMFIIVRLQWIHQQVMWGKGLYSGQPVWISVKPYWAIIGELGLHGNHLPHYHPVLRKETVAKIHYCYQGIQLCHAHGMQWLQFGGQISAR